MKWIREPEQLAELPNGALIIDAAHDPMLRQFGWWYSPGDDFAYEDRQIPLPALLIGMSVKEIYDGAKES